MGYSRSGAGDEDGAASLPALSSDYPWAVPGLRPGPRPGARVGAGARLHARVGQLLPRVAGATSLVRPTPRRPLFPGA
jgi:hypothetical protein